MSSLVQESVTFLRSVGLEIEFSDVPHPNAFVPGVWMDEGRLVVHLATVHACDILHEAGHLATVPTALRGLTRPGDFPGPLLAKAATQAWSERGFVDEYGREDVLLRSLLQMGECEATAWSFAATVAMSVSATILIEPRADGSIPYETTEAASGILDGLQARQYFGIHGLAAAGFCKLREFPKMQRWLAP